MAAKLFSFALSRELRSRCLAITEARTPCYRSCYRLTARYGVDSVALTKPLEEATKSPRIRRKTDALWRIESAVCLARYPKLTQPKPELQVQFRELQQLLREERSRLSEYELEEKRMEQVVAERAKVAEEDLIPGALDETSVAEEFSELALTRQQELSQFVAGPRVTVADRTNDLHSTDRQLECTLYLLVKRKATGDSDGVWQVPQGRWREGETSLMETASRALGEECGSNVDMIFLSNAPRAFLSYRSPQSNGNRELGAKVFFLNAQWTGGDMTIDGDKLNDHAWVTRDEMKQLVSNDYYKAIAPALLD